MMKAFIFISLISGICFGQSISISPFNTIERTISLTYYDSEFIFITNTGNQPINLNFELIENTLPQEWSSSGCTNVICYTEVPDDGTFGEMPPGYQAYMSINLATNNVPGSGHVRYFIYDKANPENNDTLAFFYVAKDEIIADPQPWAKMNFSQNVITVFLENESISSTLKIFDSAGKLIVWYALEDITSISLVGFAPGIYIAAVESKNGNRLVQKIAVKI